MRDNARKKGAQYSSNALWTMNDQFTLACVAPGKFNAPMVAGNEALRTSTSVIRMGSTVTEAVLNT
jgi:hypothetical protein